VAVVGGGLGGISAALAAARGGKKVILFERQFILGGLATAGLVTVYLPLCDGYGTQVSFGIAEELFKLSIKHGASGRYPENWLDGVGGKTDKDPRYMVDFNPQMFAILTEQLLLSEGVKIMYGSYVVDAEAENSIVKCIHVENKSGRCAYYVDSVIDASGDFDIGHFIEAKSEKFKSGNLLAAWYYTSGDNGYRCKQFGFAEIPDEEKKTETKTLGSTRYTGLDAAEVTDMVCASHMEIYKDYLKRRESGENIELATLATIPQLRMTRRIVGDYTLSYDEQKISFSDSIGMISDWRKRGPVWEVPFRTLYSSDVKNLITAGRITSVTERMWDVMRVIPCCAVTGEAAGTAAALTNDFTTLDVKILQRKLSENGVRLHLGEVLN
jgi:hypothetical protein